jgi:cell division septation protein DedD
VLVGAGGLFVGLNYDDVKSYFGWDKFDETQPVTQLQENEVTPSVITDEMEENTIEEVEEDPFIGEVESIEAVEEVVAPAPEAKVAPVTSVPTPSPQPADRSGQPYHLIGGSFTEKGNADNFVRDMQSKGYASHIVGEFNGMHMVSVKSFATREAAMNELSTIQNDAPKAWLFKHPK